MAKPCKNKEDVIKRNMAYKRLCRINHWHPGLPPPELYGSKTKKTGELTLNDIVEGLPK